MDADITKIYDKLHESYPITVKSSLHSLNEQFNSSGEKQCPVPRFVGQGLIVDVCKTERTRGTMRRATARISFRGSRTARIDCCLRTRLYRQKSVRLRGHVPR